MKTLYVTDMDGTLLNNESRVSDRSARIISDLTRRGALITVATARTPATVVPLLGDTLIAPPAIVMTGAALWDHANRRFRHLVTMSVEMAERVIEVTSSLDIHPFVYSRRDASSLRVAHLDVALTPIEAMFIEQRKRTAFKTFEMVSVMDKTAMTDVCLIFAFGDQRRITAAAEILRAAGRFSVSCYPERAGSEIYLLEVFDVSVTKARAIEMVKAQTGADRVVVFGDNLNDISMFSVADLSVAVANALDEVRAAADMTIEPNTTDAVARFIEADFSN